MPISTDYSVVYQLIKFIFSMLVCLHALHILLIILCKYLKYFRDNLFLWYLCRWAGQPVMKIDGSVGNL